MVEIGQCDKCCISCVTKNVRKQYCLGLSFVATDYTSNVGAITNYAVCPRDAAPDTLTKIKRVKIINIYTTHTVTLHSSEYLALAIPEMRRGQRN